MEFGQQYTDYQLKNRSLARQLARKFYLNGSLRLLEGRTIDFGCGTGELLQKLPAGSVGLEINKFTVDFCRDKGLNVLHYDPQIDKYQLSSLRSGAYESLVLSHVLEHIENPAPVLRSLLQSSCRLGVKRVVIIVPGKKGFLSDPTHKTYIDPLFFRKNNITESEGFEMVKQKYFPVNLRFIERFFAHLELHVVYGGKSG